jgi:hypothetical protein
MATSKTKKRRLHHERQTGYNPEFKRGDWNGVNPIEKKTPTKIAKVQRTENKHREKWNHSKDNGEGSIIFFVTFC